MRNILISAAFSAVLLSLLLTGNSCSATPPAAQIKEVAPSSSQSQVPDAGKPGPVNTGAPAIVSAQPEPKEALPLLDATDTKLLLKYVGQRAMVKGTIVEFNTIYDDNKRPVMVYFANQGSHVVNWEDWQKSQAGTDFRAVLRRESFSKFPDLDEYYGENVTIEGTIEVFKSGPAIFLIDRSQLTCTTRQVAKVDLPENLKNSKMLFISDRDSNPDPIRWGGDGKGEIYMMNADGSNVVKLTNLGARSRCPSWSPDRTRIAFMSDRDTAYPGAFDIYVMNADGSDIKRLTSNHGSNLDPKWSPDGHQIVFASSFGAIAHELDVFRMNPDGSDITQLTFTPPPSSSYAPCYTPDGKSVIYISNYEGRYAVSKLDLQAGETMNLLQIDNKYADWPTVSPDGSKIAFHTYEDNKMDLLSKNYKICVMNIDGTGKKVITSDPTNDVTTTDWYPSWSPDGTKLTFTSAKRCKGIWQQFSSTNLFYNGQIYIMNADGTGMARIPYIWGSDWYSSWN